LVYGVMGVANADGYSSVTAGTAMALGLVARARGYGGQNLLTTMLSSMSHAISEDMVRYAGRGQAPTADSEHLGLQPLYRLYEASDGWVFLAAPAEADWAKLGVALAEVPELTQDERFATAEARAENPDALATALESVFRTKAAADWEPLMRAADVACVEVAHGPVDAAFLGPDAIGAAADMVTTCRHSTLDEVPRLKPLVRFSRSATVAGDPCAIGEHTLSILGDLGYSPADIDALAASKVIGL
jgi:crotonobetainyl-CoA:carnitine CoA-transferase CaiB-like acyl-CoA transferase